MPFLYPYFHPCHEVDSISHSLLFPPVIYARAQPIARLCLAPLISLVELYTSRCDSAHLNSAGGLLLDP